MNKMFKMSRMNNYLFKEEIKNSVGIVKLSWLKEMNKIDLMEIILLREQMINDKMHQWMDSLKHNDREVFINLREHNKELLNSLLDEKPFVKKLMDKIDVLDKQSKEFKTQYNLSLKKVQDLLGRITTLKYQLKGKKRIV